MNDDTGWWLDEYDGPRFWSKVDRHGGTAHMQDPLATAEGECWLWTGSLFAEGYGQFRMGPKMVRAHRVAYLDGSQKSKIPEGHEIDHLCRNHQCVRPTHLEAVSHQENLERGSRSLLNRETCNHGHSLSPDNIVIRKRGAETYRACRICCRERRRRNYLRSKS